MSNAPNNAPASVAQETADLPQHVRRDELGLPAPYVAPNSWVKHRLAEIWRTALKVEPIGIDDNFFDLGGDSLSAAEIFSNIEETFHVRLPLGELLKTGTVRLLADRLKKLDLTDNQDVLAPVRSSGERAPLYLVHGLPGTVLFANVLAPHLSADRPVYGIQAPIYDGCPIDQALDLTVASMATRSLSVGNSSGTVAGPL